MDFAAGQLPDKPGLYRAEQQLASLRLFTRAGDVLKYPAYLRAREIRVDYKPCLGAVFLREPFGDERITVLRSAAVLPDYGVIYGFSGRLVPDNSCFSLVCDAYGGNVFRGGSKL